MSSDDMPVGITPVEAPRPRRPAIRNAVLLTLLAFVAGIGVAAALIRNYAGMLGMEVRPLSASAAASALMPGFVPPPEAGSAAIPDRAALDARQSMLDARLADLETRAAMIDRESRLAAGNAGHAEAMLVAFAARRRIDRGLALGNIEAALHRHFDLVQPRAVIAVARASRMPVTIEELRLGLDTLAPTLANGGIDGGWWQSLRREIGNLIVIRRETTPSPHPADRLARIRRLLDAEQVEAALAEVARLPGAAKAGGWMEAASRYVEAHQALDAIESTAIEGRASDMAVASAN